MPACREMIYMEKRSISKGQKAVQLNSINQSIDWSIACGWWSGKNCKFKKWFLLWLLLSSRGSWLSSGKIRNTTGKVVQAVVFCGFPDTNWVKQQKRLTKTGHRERLIILIYRSSNHKLNIAGYKTNPRFHISKLSIKLCSCVHFLNPINMPNFYPKEIPFAKK